MLVYSCLARQCNWACKNKSWVQVYKCKVLTSNQRYSRKTRYLNTAVRFLLDLKITVFSLPLLSRVKINVVSEDRWLDRNSRRRTCWRCWGECEPRCSFWPQHSTTWISSLYSCLLSSLLNCTFVKITLTENILNDNLHVFKGQRRIIATDTTIIQHKTHISFAT